MRLMIAPQRGVGWNWEVKGVPSHPYINLGKWKFVAVHLGWTGWYYMLSLVMLAILGWSSAMREEMEDGFRTLQGELNYEVFTFNAVIGWSGAIWVWCRLCCAYSMATVLSVSVGVFETWEWPPLMGSLDDAWSVRQMWSVVYHQTFRRVCVAFSNHFQDESSLIYELDAIPTRNAYQPPVRSPKRQSDITVYTALPHIRHQLSRPPVSDVQCDENGHGGIRLLHVSANSYYA
jgi:hypothetical protein